MAVFSVWESETCGITLKQGAGLPMLGGEPEDPNAVKVLEFQAASWNEACQKKNDHYGWGVYQPHDGWEAVGPEEECS